MSQENVEVVQAANEAYSAGDMDALRKLYDPDVIVRMAEGWPEPGPLVGAEAVIRQWERQREAFDTQTLEAISDFVQVGDRVVVRLLWRGTGHGPEANLDVTSLSTVRNGKLVTIDFFWDHAEALEAAGLSEQDAHADS